MERTAKYGFRKKIKRRAYEAGNITAEACAKSRSNKKICDLLGKWKEKMNVESADRVFKALHVTITIGYAKQE